jgi:uncharacterized protein
LHGTAARLDAGARGALTLLSTRGVVSTRSCAIPRCFMKTSLDHLPLGKQRELEHVKTVLMEEFDKALAGGTQPWRRSGKIVKMILFGSFGRGDWVDDRVSGYKSDWDLLIVVSHERLKPIEDFWWEAEERLLRDHKAKRVKHPVNIIVHTLDDVNSALSRGEYFWTDILRDGVMLFERPGHPLGRPGPLTPAQAYEMATRCYEDKIAKARRRRRTLKLQIVETQTDPGFLLEAAFTTHQVVETLYGCFLLVKTLYLPYSHNIKFLRSLSEDLDRRLVPAWPRDTKKESSRFELLKRAYVEARYSEHYKISAEDLATLTTGADELRGLVDAVCRERLDELKAQAEL